MKNKNLYPLYCSQMEHDNCGIGAVVDIHGRKSRDIVTDALKIVENLEHRAGKDADGATGDGVGILVQIPHTFFARVCAQQNIPIGQEREYGVGMFFFSQNEHERTKAQKMFEVIVKKEGLVFLGWRPVPIVPHILGRKARERMPVILQSFVGRPAHIPAGLDFDRRLYVVRRVFEHSNGSTYVASLSSRTIVYKGMLLVGQLRTFFEDLQAPDFSSAIAIVHSRFSTNTEPSWKRAHPNRLIVHNGEINTIRGNVDKMLAREETMRTQALCAEDLNKVLPVIHPSGSDSAMLDNALEFLMMCGMPLPLAVMIAIPEPWSHNDTLSQERRDFYQYYATMMEPWDGPASILFSDGDVMGAVLDRNGLRPSRYCITADGRLILASEVGVLDLDDSQILKKERLHPGKMLLVDTQKGEVLNDEAVKEHYAGAHPYGEWLDSHLLRLRQLHVPNERVPALKGDDCARLLKAFGYTWEETRGAILAMALNGNEAIGAMGTDTPLAVLSHEYQPLFAYFKQMFAQVTNPPIDAAREKIVTSTTVYAGKSGNLLDRRPENCQVLKIENPILNDLDLLKIKHMKQPGFHVAIVSILFYKTTALDEALENVFLEVDKAYRDGANILILSDRGVDENHVAIPSLLAVSAVHKHLVKTRKCTALSLILESGEPREVHHFAALLGYGACAVNPYLAHAAIAQLIEAGLLEKDYYAAVDDYDRAVLQGIVKVASKMGISTIQSYQGSQIFEALGIAPEVINAYFTGTISRVGGLTLKDIAARTEAQHSRAFDPLGLPVDLSLPSVGKHKMRIQGEHHRYDPETIHLLQRATRENNYSLFKEYTQRVDDERTGALRSCMEFVFPKQGIPLEEVEPVESIVRRFKTGAMSYGSISQEAHEALAIAMNHLHGKSNSGEGGESDERLASAGTEHDRSSAIKQIASGRFGVTSRYLVSAKELQIKMAQGAKPGEGGHLPGRKVYPWIAKTRHSTPGVSLISPPPHHDIYSIEDLAQLIYDLKNANCNARISVKLVAEAGVGTVAAGVAKAGAQVILISGHDGGTGAAPLSSIHNAGLPWELGLAEAHQTLIRNGLRQRVVLETDGKLMSGRDVAIAALLGAEEFGFATAPLVTLGCVMMRVCDLDTCPMGVATQNPELRKRFCGKPEYVEHFMCFIAQELREYMAKLGVHTVDEMVGRTDFLRAKPVANGEPALDLSGILTPPVSELVTFNPAHAYDFRLERTKDEEILLRDEGIRKAITDAIPCHRALRLRNTDRTFGTLLGAEITRRHPDGLPEDCIHLSCTGAGGQSFGAFVPRGLTLSLCGDSNDYFGKGLSGGKLILFPPSDALFSAEENIIVGNVALYGATSGTVYINGVAGERFCVRNSGARAVVEGVGEHGCEYMTGGCVVVLGPTGKNFAAGMSGGVAYVLDEKNELYRNLNKEMVVMESVDTKFDQQELLNMIRAHFQATGSSKARRILASFETFLPKFKKIIPTDYKRLLQLSTQFEKQGMDREAASIEAFYASTRAQ
mgnify:CR=1 FL=1